MRHPLASRACAFAPALTLAFLVTPPLSAQVAHVASASDLAEARDNYIAICGRCHGVDGGGGEGPPLARAELPRASDDAALIRIMNLGIPGTAMPGTRWLSEAELSQLARYVRSLAPSAPPSETVAGDPARGRELYERGRCAECHTVGGFGTARGPELTAVGLRRGASYLREAVLDPEAALPRGLTALPLGFADYLMVRVVDANGTEVRGMRMNEDTYTIQLKDARGVVHSFYKPDLREIEKQFDRSLMRSYRDAFSDTEVDDLVSYLMSLQGPAPRLIS